MTIRFAWVLFLSLLGFVRATAQENPAPTFPKVIEIATSRFAVRLVVGSDERLYQQSFGKRRNEKSWSELPPAQSEEFHPASGNGYLLEPALQIVHADGNISTELVVATWESRALDSNVVLTRIELRDRYYPLSVSLCFRAYRKEDVIEQWVEIQHEESKPIELGRLASSAPRLHANSYWVTQFQGDVMREGELMEERLSPGTKIFDSKLTVRAHLHRNPSFILSLDQAATEESGEVLGGTLAWSGNFQFAFDLDWDGGLRVLSGVNPFGSHYKLEPRKLLKTPAMLWTWSDAGKGQVSRNFHGWARDYGIRDGGKRRPVLLNNWETTYFDFNESKLLSLFDGGKDLGVDLFLLDDGWFSDKEVTNVERVGLGDWIVNRKILPHGLPYLVEEAKRRGLGFGIWMEPEGVHSGSNLYREHPEWVLRQPHRQLEELNHQVLLDLTRPAVKEYVWSTIDKVLGQPPGIGYIKWDANRYALQPGSEYLSPENQQNLSIEYQLGLYDVMRRMADKYPLVESMLCAGGGGRVDYGALKYFDSFWPSDNTDPVQRIYIQWSYSHIFPTWAMSDHVTSAGARPTKFALDVALQGALGIDRDPSKMTDVERDTIRAAITLYKTDIQDLVARGDLYRLESPYAGKRVALNYVLPDKSRALLFVYQLGETAFSPVKLRGLDPNRRYHIKEINLPPGISSRLALNEKTVSGASLMSDGIVSPLKRALESAVIECLEDTTSGPIAVGMAPNPAMVRASR